MRSYLSLVPALLGGGALVSSGTVICLQVQTEPSALKNLALMLSSPNGPALRSEMTCLLFGCAKYMTINEGRLSVGEHCCSHWGVKMTTFCSLTHWLSAAALVSSSCLALLSLALCRLAATES